MNSARPGLHRLLQVRTPREYDSAPCLETTCYHEASHALLRILTGCPLTTVAVQDNNGAIFGFAGNIGADEGLQAVSAGDTVLTAPRPLPDVADEFKKPLAMRKICVALAGCQAELLLHGVALDGPVFRDDDDHKRATSMLRDGFGFVGYNHLFYPQALTRYYLARNWTAVRKMAKALLDRCERDGAGVLRRGDMACAAHFSPESLNVKWRDENWI